MIGARPALVGSLAIVGLALVMGQRAADPLRADPPTAAAARGLVRARAEAAAATLDALTAALRDPLAAARRGSARTVAGDEDPGPELLAAATGVGDAVDEADAANRALGAVRGALRAVGMRPPPGAVATPAELASIATQLSGTAAAADGFAAARREADAVVEGLDAALQALDGGSPETSLDVIDEVEARRMTLASWRSVDPAVMSVWLDTTGAMTESLADLARAVIAEDAAAAAAAGEAFAAASESAREADVALQIAVSEGGGAVAAAPLRRLAEELARIDAVRAEVARIVHPGSSPSP